MKFAYFADKAQMQYVSTKLGLGKILMHFEICIKEFFYCVQIHESRLDITLMKRENSELIQPKLHFTQSVFRNFK